MQTVTQTSPSWIARTGGQIDRIRLNELRKEKVGGEMRWVKRRTASSRWLVPVANLFFRLAGNPVRVLPTGTRWQQREVALFQLLNNQRPAGLIGESAVYFEPVPGNDLVALLSANRLSCEVMRRVGEAFSNMHGKLDPLTGRAFSHGDPHLGNVVANLADESFGWIDFETEHLPGLTSEERQADDLLVFLLDLAGRVGWEEWTMLGIAFVEGYARPAIIVELKKHLILQTGFAGIWQAVRTSYLAKAERKKRLAWLHAKL